MLRNCLIRLFRIGCGVRRDFAAAPTKGGSMGVSPSKGGSSGKGASDKGNNKIPGKTGSTEKTVLSSGETLNPEYPSQPSMYDVRKYGHNLPCHNIMIPFEALPCMPTGLFRCTYGEVLGPGADKCGSYPVPEYFAFHHMSFYDFHLLLRPFRMPSPYTYRKP